MATQHDERDDAPEHTFNLSVTFDRWTEADREQGEPGDRGFTREAGDYDAEELARLARHLGLSQASVQNTGNGLVVGFISTTPDENNAHFRHGVDTYYTLHLHSVDGQPLTEESVLLAAETMGVSLEPFGYVPATPEF
ncbi:hypothetical protein [Geopseudomonas aromaticivorans]